MKVLGFHIGILENIGHFLGLLDEIFHEVLQDDGIVVDDTSLFGFVLFEEEQIIDVFAIADCFDFELLD
jgi:hypothetical protein